MRIAIGGKQVETGKGKSILDTALENGIYIPHLCGHPDLEAAGGCRLCSVEIEGLEHPVPSCTTEVAEGMVVSVNSPKAEKVRKMAMELILSSHPADCTGCPKYGKCELQSMFQFMGVSPDKWRLKSNSFLTDETNPLIRHLFTRCVLCGRCVRACRELRGVKVLDYQRTADGEIKIGTDGGRSLKEAGCRFCGACIEVCPTGSIMDAVGLMPADMPYNMAVVPCRTACPAQTDVPRYIRYIKEGNYAAATAVIRERVPFPLTLGTVCNHVCETKCKRNELGEPISICKLKKTAAEGSGSDWKKYQKKAVPTGKKVGIIGAGPAGLTCAYYLAIKGHQITVFEANSKAGGQCALGIPSYRLPDATIDSEVEDILSLGIELKSNTKIEKPKEILNQGFDAVLISTGTHKGMMLPIEGNQLQGVMVNTDFLKNTRLGNPPETGKRVMVLGGGNVAFDCARTALRLGAEEVHMACLESFEEMIATPEEMSEGIEEGIILHHSCTFTKITGRSKVEGVELKKVSCFFFDENRKAVVESVEGSEEVIAVDNVIFAVGQKPDGTDRMDLQLAEGGLISVNKDLATDVPGIFAAGDVVTGTKSVIEAIAAGRLSAVSIDRFLGGDGDISEIFVEKTEPPTCIGRIEGFADMLRLHPKQADVSERIKSFSPVEGCFTDSEAESEAGRCLQCDLRLNLTNPRFWNEYKENV